MKYIYAIIPNINPNSITKFKFSKKKASTPDKLFSITACAPTSETQEPNHTNQMTININNKKITPITPTCAFLIGLL